MNNLCKNCGAELQGKYCSNCGQPAELKRIDSHYIAHEIGHILHFEKGIFFTIKELFLRPGRSIREFIHENRSRLIKPIIFIVVTSLIYTLINHYFHIEEQYVNYKGIEKTTAVKMLKWVQDHYGYANILMSIFIAFFLSLFFKKYKYNIYELIIMLCFVIGVGMLIFSLFMIIEGLTHLHLFVATGIAGTAYVIFGIADFFDRKKISSYLKSLGAYLLGILTFNIILVIIGITIDLVMKPH